jgi:4,5:9,10-diseco-3-hydroxy-5,9,17-trioxoandrosta-1(10),2-diene-4-oate hydrolase
MDFKAMKVGKFADIGDGLKVHYHERGSGKPVIFLHGGGQGASGFSNWKQNLDHVAEHGYRALAPDALGYGLSSKPEEATFNLTLLVGGLSKLIDALNLSDVTLVGNSMGGAMALKYALDYPAKVEKVIVMGPAGIGEPSRYAAMPGIQMLFRLGQDPSGPTRDKLRQLFEIIVYDKSLITDGLIEERYEVAVTQPRRVFQTLQIDNLTPRLRELRMPVLVLWGRDDKFCPVDGGMDIVRACDSARLVVFSQCGHWVQTEKAAEFNRLCIDFLQH